jgi:DNA polymerase III delta prime subunit
MRDDYLWVEKYRPKDVTSCILPKTIKETFQQFVDQKDVPNLILSGGPGVGKTTIAKAMLNQLDSDFIVINGSMSGNIDTLRNEIKQFASSVSFSGGRKYVILDEADYLNPQSTQPALRGFIEEFHKNCGFILTCNYKNRLIEPLHSRCSVIEFSIPKSEKQTLASEFMKRLISILDTEQVKYDKRVLAEVINNHFPDWRRVLNELQRYSISGQIDAGILVNLNDVNTKELMKFMKDKEFTNVRKWVIDNLDNDPVRLLRSVYDNLYEYVDGSSIPHCVVVLGEYQYKSAFVADQEINTMACLTEIMARAKFK